jgi:uncharacterized protein (DUF4415 family)
MNANREDFFRISVLSPVLGSDLAKVDAHIIQPEEYEDIPEITDEMIARGTWKIGGREVSRAEGEAAFRAAARRGRPAGSGTKTAIKLRVDSDVVAAFKASGKGWQTRMNEVLRDYVRTHPLGEG